MGIQIEKHDLFYRAQWVIFRDFDSGFFAGIRDCNPDQWQECEANIVAEYVLSFTGTEPVYEIWHKFPGGWPRFLDMRDRAKLAAQTEQGSSTIDWFSCAMTNEVLKADNIGGK